MKELALCLFGFFFFFSSKESSVHTEATVATVARGIEKRQTMGFAVRVV